MSILVKTKAFALVRKARGGTTSQITGGKFANGAISGAFVHLFNAEMKKALNTVSIARDINRIKSRIYRI
jgi:hypothetical protein